MRGTAVRSARTMLAASALFGCLAGGAASAAEPAPGFVPPAEKVEKPYTNEKCLDKCHGLPGFGAGGPDGRLRDLHVEAADYVFTTHGQKGIECVDCHADADPNFHPRTGYARVDCRACHSETPPAGAFPPDALQRLQAKGIKSPPKEAQKGEGWIKTKHGAAWQEGKPQAPFCSGCHTAHRVRRADDPASAVHQANLARTCGACHPEQVAAEGVGGRLARFRISAHGKGDLSSRYSACECLSCHQGEAAHGEESITGQACPACHRVPEQAGRVKYASLHIKPSSPEQPLARALGWVYGAGFWTAGGVAALLLLFLGFSTAYRRRDG